MKRVPKGIHDWCYERWLNVNENLYTCRKCGDRRSGRTVRQVRECDTDRCSEITHEMRNECGRTQ